ncbi:hypothetical protein BKA62DRAFT_775240 [Auriculariales sp. MPI-PUGE-AT-0066]|nr:hypothetical protein BKA62DRAFT_775240 [Auriculariales sp. MPI-PUGE-AT-0066]
MFAQQYIHQQHPQQQQQQEYAVQTAPAFAHPPPLPLNAYTQPPQLQQQQDQKPFTSAHDLNSPSTTAAPPAIARHHHHQQLTQQQQQHTPAESFGQQQQHQSSLTHSPEFIADSYAPHQHQQHGQYQHQASTDPDFQQHQYAQEFALPHAYAQAPEYAQQQQQQQQQQQLSEYAQLADEYGQLQDAHEYGVPGQPSFMNGIGGVNGLQSFGIKRPRGEKISSKASQLGLPRVDSLAAATLSMAAPAWLASPAPIAGPSSSHQSPFLFPVVTMPGSHLDLDMDKDEPCPFLPNFPSHLLSLADSLPPPIPLSLQPFAHSRPPHPYPYPRSNLHAYPPLPSHPYPDEPTGRPLPMLTYPSRLADFVPPDVSGLSKREARLVKNRAAAFLSRQRKREEFEAMELRVTDLEQQNSSLLSQLSGAMPVGDAAHEAHIRALQARIAGLEQELDGYRRTHGPGGPQPGESRSPSPGNNNSLKPSGHARGRSYDSFDSSLSGHSGASAAGRMTDTQREAVVGMGLMALLSLTSMSPPTTKFAFTPADNADEPTPVTATPFNYDSIARWQERLAASASALPTVSGSPPEGTTLPVPTTSNPSGEATKAEFDIAFSTTDDGRIRCHVSVPKNQMAHIMAIHAAKAQSQSQNQSFPNTPYSAAGSLHSSHSGASGSPESNGLQSHPGSASSFHTTFESAGYQTQYAPPPPPMGQQLLQVNEDAWAAQHRQWTHVQLPVQQAPTMQLQPTQPQDWAAATASSAVTPIAPRPQQGPLASVKHEDKEHRKQLGPTRRVRVALKASSGRGEWEVEVC